MILILNNVAEKHYASLTARAVKLKYATLKRVWKWMILILNNVAEKQYASLTARTVESNKLICSLKVPFWKWCIRNGYVEGETIRFRRRVCKNSTGHLTPGENKGIAMLTPLNAIDTHSRPFNDANPQKKQTIFVWTTILRLERWQNSHTFSIAYVEINVIHCGTWPYHRKCNHN